MPELLVIIPTYNEAGSLGTIVARTRAGAPSVDILIVDDNSPDGTGAIADALAGADSHVTVLHRTAKDGLGRAYLDGFAVGLERGYAYLAEMDADGSHDPAELPAMLELARSGADLVIGSRLVPGGSVLNWPRYRQAISQAGNAYARFMLRSRIRDITAGFRVFRAEAVRSIASSGVSSQGYCFQVEVAWRLERGGATVTEHPITFVERATGRSKMHLGIVTEALLRVTGWGLAAGPRKR